MSVRGSIQNAEMGETLKTAETLKIFEIFDFKDFKIFAFLPLLLFPQILRFNPTQV